MLRKIGSGRWTSARSRRLAFFAPFLLAVAAGLLPVQGQNLPNLSQEQLQQLQQLQLQQGQRQPAVSDSASQPNLVLQPEMQQRQRLAQSRLEQIMSERAGAQLQQFGYDQMGSGRTVTQSQSGGMQNDYVLGIGDELVISLRGQENNEFRLPVDRNGQVLVPRINPLPAAGRTLSDFTRDLQAIVQRAYISTNAFVSVLRVRQISVLVSGEVNNPGQRLLTGLSSVVDALLLSGGIRKTGSLRNVRIQRGGREINVDLYAVLTSRGGASAMRLADGDRILVPLLGGTVAISGLVRQPGIFELPPRQTTIAASDLLQLAGGQEVRGLYRFSVLRIGADGRSTLDTLPAGRGELRDSEILFVQLGANQVMNQAMLSGGTGLAGNYVISRGTKPNELLRAPGAMGDTPYSLFGLIVRRNPQSFMRTLVAFTPVAVLAGREDIDLQGDDMVRIFSTTEARLLDYIMRSYLARLSRADQALRNPLARETEARTISAGFNSVQRETQQEQQLASVHSYINNVPSEIQRSTITALMEEPAPGSPQARADQLRRERDAQLFSRQVSGSAGPAVPANQTALTPSQQQQQQQQQQLQQQDGTGAESRFRQQSEADTFEGRDLAGNFQDSRAETDRFARNREAQTFGQLVRQLNVDPLVLINFLVECRARLEGAVRGPGDYLLGPSATLNDLVQAAGGTAGWADQKGVELITTVLDRVTGVGSTRLSTLPSNGGMLASYVVRPGDQLRFAQISTATVGSVTIQGEVRNPGTFSVLRGDKLSDVLARAGGLTETAYPAGTVFLRQSAAQQERDGFIRAAKEVQDQLVVAMTRVGNSKIDPATFASMQIFVQELRQQRALGRISVVADPSVLASRPEQDPLLEAGDVVYVPQRPNTISVLGQVLQPGNFPYSPGQGVAELIRRAGGYAQTADESQTFIVLPDGSARRLEQSWLRFETPDLPPGSIIVVPRDVTPLDLRQTIIDVTQILSQLAVSIASVAVISNQTGR